MKISVIIPVYNVEKYLPRCIESVLAQTYTDLEIILVDDGSKDRSGALCDEYAGLDDRILVIHKDNGGLSSARNSGLEIATGEAVFFLDSDDYISKDSLSTCVNIMKKYDADEVIIKLMYIPEYINEELPDNDPYFEICMNSEEAIEQSLYQVYFTCSAHTRVYKRHVIGDIRFPLNKLSEDLATCHKFFANASKIVYVNKVGTYYRQQGSSIMHSFRAQRFDAVEWAHQIESYCRQYYPKIIKAAYTRTFNVAVHLLFDIPYPDDNYESYRKILMAEIRRTRRYVLFNKKSRKREKMAALISLLGAKTLRTLWKSGIANKVKKDAFSTNSL